MKIRAVNLDAYAMFVMKDKASNEFSIVRNDDADKLIKSKRYNSLSPANIITRLNNSRERFLPSVNKTLLIIFYDFSMWTKFKNLPKRSLGRFDISYKSNKECIKFNISTKSSYYITKTFIVVKVTVKIIPIIRQFKKSETNMRDNFRLT